MTSRLTLCPARNGAPWELDAVPSSYSEAARVQLRAMPGVRWVPDEGSPNGRGYFRGPHDAIRIAARTLQDAGVLRVRDKYGFEFTGTRVFPVGPIACSYPRELREYQHAGAHWCANMLRAEGAALLADEMGIGKSAQAIAALDALGAPETIIICPAVVKPHWITQIRRWSSRDGMPWHVYSYEGFQKALKRGELPPGVRHLVLDEVHYLSNPKSQRSKAVRAFLGAHPDVKRLALSGTPMTARPRDLWNPLDLLWPGRWGTKWEFEKRYCDGHYEEIKQIEKSVWVSDGASRLEELHERLAACMLRRTKADVALELPPRQRVVIDVELPAKARKSLAQANAQIAPSLGRGSGWISASIATLLSNIEGYKIEAACALARDAVANGSRVLILTTRKASAEAIGAELSAPFTHGDDAPEDRHSKIADAQIGVATIYSVTTGIDLVGFDVLIFTGLDWVPSTLLQAEARIHRLGQLRNCTIYYLIGAGTLDEIVRERVIERLDQFAVTMGADASEGLSGELSGSEEDLIAQIVVQMKEAA